MTQRYGPWPAEIVERIARVLGETSTGLSGSEIATLLAASQVPDADPLGTKWRRIRDSLVARQQHDHASNCVIRFITEAMAPVRYVTEPARFTHFQDALNEVLVFQGAFVDDQGKVRKGAQARTLAEAATHASALRSELLRRRVHSDVLRYCGQEVLERNPFHAALEATKSVPERLRSMTGMRGDGAALIDATLALGQRAMPKVAINAGLTDSERGEQTGFANLCKGLLGMFRNPTAHDARIKRRISDDELLELLMVVSMIHRRLDGATVQP